MRTNHTRWTNTAKGAAALVLVLVGSGVASPQASAASAPVGPTVTRSAGPLAMQSEPGRVSVIINVAKHGNMAKAAAIARRHGLRVVQRWPKIRVLVVVASKQTTLRQAAAIAERIQRQPEIGSAGVSGVVAAQNRPVARHTAANTNRSAIGPFATAANSVQANQTSTGAGVTVGVADTGVYDEHAALRGRVDLRSAASCVGGRIISGRNQGRPTQVGDTHGTQVSSVIAAQPGTGPLQGIAPDATIAPLRVVNDQGFIYPEAAICAQMWAVDRGIGVLNESFGIDWAGQLTLGSIWSPGGARQKAAFRAIAKAHRYARSHGVTTVAASGNDGFDLARKPSIEPPAYAAGTRLRNSMKLIPAQLPGVVTVSGTQSDGSIDGFSNVGLGVITLAAVDAGRMAARPGRFVQDAGTSFAAPAVTGAAALILQLRPEWGPARLRAALTASATARSCRDAGELTGGQPCRNKGGRTNFFGAGTLDAAAAVAVAADS